MELSVLGDFQDMINLKYSEAKKVKKKVMEVENDEAKEVEKKVEIQNLILS